MSIQVKTVRQPAPAGGTGQPANSWSFPHDCKAELLAFVRLSTDSVWLFTLDEARTAAQQHSAKGNRQLYWYTDEQRAPQAARREGEFDRFRIEERVGEFFLGATPTPPELGPGELIRNFSME